eukprot:9958313-Ditylum_brightwellii.AAC.1
MEHTYNVDCYPVQFKYYHSTDRSDVSHNSIISSKKCCISTNGTSDVTISNNTALLAPGMSYQLRGIKFHYFEQGIQENKAKHMKQLVIANVKSYQSKVSAIRLHYILLLLRELLPSQLGQCARTMHLISMRDVDINFFPGSRFAQPYIFVVRKSTNMHTSQTADLHCFRMCL